MTRMLTAAGALALAAMTISGVAHANPPYREIVAPPTHWAQVSLRQPASWHYEWRYHYGKWGQYVPGWVPVLDSAR
ncbi:MAG TPA: hypothetical protein VJ770_01090 [Stellaceae bacterium]|nr:hypothetical protein [Stellaceae bacterium]